MNPTLKHALWKAKLSILLVAVCNAALFISPPTLLITWLSGLMVGILALEMSCYATLYMLRGDE